MTDTTQNSDSYVPRWKEQAHIQLEPYLEGLRLLAGALEFATDRLQAIEITDEELFGSGGRAVLPILAARAVGTVDGVHALLAAGRVEQAEMLIRTLVDLQADAYILAADERAIGYYVDWATVEQARTALQMNPDEIVRPGRDLHERRQELADELVRRLAEHDEETAAKLADRPLDEVLPAFCKERYGSRWPPNWRRGYSQVVGLTTDDVRELIIRKALEVLEHEEVARELRDEFEQTFERELELLFGHLSGEIHNSPLSMNRLFDQSTLTIRVHGDLQGLPRALAAAFQHLLRILLLFESEWNPESAAAEWSELGTAVANWLERFEIASDVEP